MRGMDPRLDASSQSATHEELLNEHMEAVRLAVEQSLQTICRKMHQLAYDSARLSGSYLDQLHKENEKMRSMGGTGDAPVNGALRGNAWTEPIQPTRPQSYEDMRVALPAEVAPLIEFPTAFEKTSSDPAKDNQFFSSASGEHSAEVNWKLEETDDTADVPPRPKHSAWGDHQRSFGTREFGSGRQSEMRHSKSAAAAHEPRAVFADASAMKEKVRLAVTEQEYNVCDFYYETGWAQLIARSQPFEHLTLFVIAFNAIWISVDTDNNESATLSDADLVFQLAEHGFCIYFTGEWLIRFLAFQNKRNCLRDAWFCFDTILVGIMVSETWIMNTIILFLPSNDDEDGNSGALGNTSVLKLFRLVRLTRMARMAKLLRRIPELIILVKGIAVASRSVVFTLILLGIILYFFAIVFRQLTDDTELKEEFFESVPGSMGSLLLEGVLPDQSPIIRSCFEEHWILGLLILLFVLLATLTVMNMLVGILCQIVSVVSSVEKEELTVNYVKTRLMALFKGADADASTTISRTEFSELLTGKPEAAKIIREIGVDAVGLVDFADFIFEEQKELTFVSFMELLLSLRGTNTSTVKDIIDLRKFVLTNMKAELSKVKSEICKQVNDKVGRAVSVHSGGRGRLTATKNSFRQRGFLPPRPLDAVNVWDEPPKLLKQQQPDLYQGSVYAPTLPNGIPDRFPPKPERERPTRPFSGPTPTIVTETSLTKYEPPKARSQSANARMRDMDGPPPPLPTFPKSLPLEVNLEESASEVAMDEVDFLGADSDFIADHRMGESLRDGGTLRVGAVSERGKN